MKPKQFIAQAIQELETKIADHIGRHVNQFPIRTRKIGLIVFGIVVGTFCFLLTLGFIGNDDSKRAIPHHRLSIPKDIYSPLTDSIYQMRSDSIK